MLVLFAFWVASRTAHRRRHRSAALPKEATATAIRAPRQAADRRKLLKKEALSRQGEGARARRRVRAARAPGASAEPLRLERALTSARR